LSLPFLQFYDIPDLLSSFFINFFVYSALFFTIFSFFSFLPSEVPDSGRTARPREHVLYLKERLNATETRVTPVKSADLKCIKIRKVKMKVFKADKVQFVLLGFLIGIAALIITGCPMELNTNIGPGTSTIKGITAGDPGTVTVTVTVEVEVPGTPPPPITVEVEVPGENIKFDLNRILIVNRSDTPIADGKVTAAGTTKVIDIPLIPANSYYMLTLNPGETPVATEYQVSVPGHLVLTAPFVMPPDKVLIIGYDWYEIDDGNTVLPGTDNTRPHLVVYNTMAATTITSIYANTSQDDNSFGTLIDNSVIPHGTMKMWEVPLGAVRQYQINGPTPPVISPPLNKHTFTNWPYLIVVSDDGSTGGKVDNEPPPPVPVDGVKVSANDNSITVLITASPPSVTDFNGWMVWLNDGSSYHIPKDASPRQVIIPGLAPGLYSVAVSTIDTSGNISHPQTYPIMVGSGTGGDHDPIVPEADVDKPDHPPGSGATYVRVINQSTHPVTNVQYSKGTNTGPWLEFSGHDIAIPSGDQKLFALTPAPYSFKILGHTWNPTPVKTLAKGKEYVIIVRDADDNPQIIDPDGDDYPIIPTLEADQPDDPLNAATHARVRVINQSILYNVTNITYNSGKTFIGNPIEVNKGKQKLLAVKAGSYSFGFTVGPPWNDTPTKTLKVNKEYIIILNDSADPIIIDPDDPGTGGPEDPIIPVDDPYKPGTWGVTFISVINNSTHQVTDVQFKTASSAWLNFDWNPKTIAVGTQKLFAMKPGAYSFKFTGSGITWTPTVIRTYADGKIYLIVLSDDPPPVIIDPTDPGTGDSDDPIIPTDDPDKPTHGGITWISVINRSVTYDVANVKYNGTQTFIGKPNATDPITIAKNRQKLFAMNPGTYIFNISSSPGGRWNATPSKTYANGKTYIILLTDNADPQIIDPDGDPGIILPQIDPPPPSGPIARFSVVNRMAATSITKVQFKKGSEATIWEFVGDTSIASGTQKLFGVKPAAAAYSIIITKSGGGTLTATLLLANNGDLKYIIVDDVNDPPIIIDPVLPPEVDTTPPGPPVWQNAGAVGTTSVVLNWQNPTGTGIDAYSYILLKIGNKSGGASSGSLTTPVAIIKYGATVTVEGLTPGATYAFEIQAVDEYGNALPDWVGPISPLTVNGKNIIKTSQMGVSDNSWFVAGFDETLNKLAYSANGTAYTLSERLPGLPTEMRWGPIAYGNGRWVTLGNSAVTVVPETTVCRSAYSTDGGQNWVLGGDLGTGSQVSLGTICPVLAYGANKFVTIKNGYIWYSTDGAVSWNSTAVASTTFGNLVYGNMFVATSGNYIFYSTDGLSWTNYFMDPGSEGGSHIWRTLAYGNGRWILTNYGAAISNAAYNKYVTTTNPAGGVSSWAVQTFPGLNADYSPNFAGGGSLQWAAGAIAYGGGKWVAIPQATSAGYENGKMYMATSTNGTTWQTMAVMTLSTGGKALPAKMIYSNGMFVFLNAYIGSTSYAYYSTGGTAWTAIPLPPLASNVLWTSITGKP
jgi:hypothetical protein